MSFNISKDVKSIAETLTQKYHLGHFGGNFENWQFPYFALLYNK